MNIELIKVMIQFFPPLYAWLGFYGLALSGSWVAER